MDTEKETKQISIAFINDKSPIVDAISKDLLTSGIEKAVQVSIESLGKNTTTLMDQLIKDHKELNEALMNNYKAVSSNNRQSNVF